ncbi:MAG: DUF393 domain-containing protein [Candidatus Omnitrophica bacterium]|nr:DUF393 domain-containing protein [Candidatus Omnitrophota bacterium]
MHKVKFAVLYDGECGLCRRSMELLRRLDWLGRVEPIDLSDWPAIRKRFPGLDQEACKREMHLVTPGGKVAVGFYAYRVLARVLPLGWLALPFLYIPGVPWIGRKVYASVAAGRHRGGCSVSAVALALTFALAGGYVFAAPPEEEDSVDDSADTVTQPTTSSSSMLYSGQAFGMSSSTPGTSSASSASSQKLDKEFHTEWYWWARKERADVQ